MKPRENIHLSPAQTIFLIFDAQKKKVDCDVRLRFSHYLGNIQILVMAFPNLITDKSMQE